MPTIWEKVYLSSRGGGNAIVIYNRDHVLFGASRRCSRGLLFSCPGFNGVVVVGLFNRLAKRSTRRSLK